jgi:hypothetical protein
VNACTWPLLQQLLLAAFSNQASPARSRNTDDDDDDLGFRVGVGWGGDDLGFLGFRVDLGFRVGV